MQTVELFCGTKSFSNVALAFGHDVFTVDNDPRHHPDLHVNVLALKATSLPYCPDILWASPPCQAFSVAAIVGAVDRERIPSELFWEIFSQMPPQAEVVS